MKISKNFDDKEFACPCCNKVYVSKQLVDMLQLARDMANIPFIITSGYRCVDYNKEVGGVPNSSHLSGKAVDIKVTSDEMRFKLVSSILSAGFKRIGIGKDFIHCDVDAGKPNKVMWVYKNK